MYLEVNDLCKSYGEGGSYTQVLKNVSLEVQQGDMCVIQGTSGSGKSTLLNCIGGLDTVDSGSIVVDGKEIVGLNAKQLSDYRREELGFVFQFYDLVPDLTVQENIQVCQYLTRSPLDLGELLQVLGGMFICLLVLMIALDCYVYCDNFNRRSILETTYEYCYTYKYPTEEVPEGGTPAYAETLRQTSYGYDLDVTMLGIDPGCPYFPEVAPTAKKSEVVIASSVAQKFGVGKGDVLVLRDEVNDVNYAFTVTDVVHYASGLYIFMDRDTMQELFGRSDDYYNTVFSDHALDIDTGLLYATVSRQNIEQASAVFTDLMMPMVILVSVLSVIIFLVVLYLMIKVMIDRASYSISLLKVFGYRTGEVRRLYLDGNFVVVALGALVCIPAAKGLMDVIYPYFVSNVAAGLELSFPPQLYAVIYAGVLACYLLIDLVLVRRLDRMTPAEVLKNRE